MSFTVQAKPSNSIAQQKQQCQYTMNNQTTDKQKVTNSGEIIDDITTPTPELPEVQQVTEQQKTPISALNNKEHAHTRKLTRKEQSFVKRLLENPKESATQAVLKSEYNVSTYQSARAIASENLAKPHIMKYLENHAEQAENTVLEVMEYSRKLGKTGTKEGASYASVALASAKEVLDRVHGKSKQQIETVSTGVTLTIDLTSSLE